MIMGIRSRSGIRRLIHWAGRANLLVFRDEFNGSTLDYTRWSPCYLRDWINHDERTRANDYSEDGGLVLRNTADDPP